MRNVDRSFLARVLVVGLVLGGAVRCFASDTEQAMVDEINRYRIGYGLPILQVDPILMDVARHRVAIYSHMAFGCMSWDEAHRAGFQGPASDNLAQGYQSASGAVSGWASSDGHAHQMRGDFNLNSRWVNEHWDVVGVAHSGSNWIAVFGRKDSK